MHAVAYHDHAYGDELARHMNEIRECGAGEVVYCVREEDLRYNRDGLVRNIATIHRSGLRCLVNFWGAFGIFGGEAASVFLAEGGRACWREPDFQAAVLAFPEFAAAAGADAIFLDEPQLRCGCCDTLGFMDDITCHARSLGLANEACIPPLPENESLLPRVARLGSLDALSSNTYYDIIEYRNKYYRVPEVHVTHWSSLLAGLGRQYGLSTRMWLQGHKQVYLPYHDDIPMHRWIRRTASAARAGGITDFALWSFRGCEGTSSLWPNGRFDECGRVWRSASEIFHTNTPTRK